jgi:hypothetical protein
VSPLSSKETAANAARLAAFAPGLVDAAARGELFDLGLRGFATEPLAHAVPILLDPLAADFGLDQMPASCRILLLRDVLQHVDDYRGLIRSAFDRLAEGGQLVVSVPHQFLYERRFRLPSRYAVSPMRFYTPASLSAEIEEALPPTGYRLRSLHDDDAGYDYDAPIEQLPAGSKHIVAVVERVAVPHWTGAMDRGDSPCIIEEKPGHVLPTAPVNPAGTRIIITPAGAEIDSILVLKLDHRGDQLIAEPAFRELRATFPDAKLTLVCGSWNVVAAQALQLFDAVQPFDIVGEDPSATRRVTTIEDWQIKFARLMQGRRYSLAMDLSGHPKTRPLLKAVDAAHKAGFDRWNEFPWMDIRLALPVPSMEGAGEQGVIGASQFMTHAGIHKRYAIDYSNASTSPAMLEKPVIWGGYRDLAPGSYTFGLAIDGKGLAQDIGFDICHRAGQVVLYSGLASLPGKVNSFLPTTPDLSVSFALTEPAENVEFRLFAVDQGPLDFRFSGVTYERASAIIGIHQGEAQALLVKLAAVRLANPFSAEIIG